MVLQILLLMYLPNSHILSTSTFAHTARRDQRMMHQILLLMYLQNSHILSTSTFAYTTRVETRA